MLLYLAYIEITYEGSNICGIFNTLEDAKTCLELEFHNKCYECVCEDGDVPDTVTQGLDYTVRLWDTDSQTSIDYWCFDQETRLWESLEEIKAKNKKRIDNLGQQVLNSDNLL